jgi:hypothetical protein
VVQVLKQQFSSPKFLLHWGRIFCLSLFIFSLNFPVNMAKAGVFDPSYATPAMNCSSVTGCCLQVSNLLKDMFTGVGNYATMNDLQKYFYTNTLKPPMETAFKKLSNELRNIGAFSADTLGSLIDGQTFNQTMGVLQRQTVETLVTQTPSDQVCRFGTLSRGLALSEEKSEAAQIGLTTYMMQRQLMTKNIRSATEGGEGKALGRSSDKAARLVQFRKVYCEPTDSNRSLDTNVCQSPSDARSNRDIDFTRGFISPMNLKADFTSVVSGNPTSDEQDIFALASNLYAHDLPVGIGTSSFNKISESSPMSDRKLDVLMDYRSLTAKRNVAQNSFAALAAMKIEGANSPSTYYKKMAELVGLDATAQTKLIGDNPSYQAQMEFLTRKMYQTPEFFANLMDSPSNVARQQAALEGIALMQDRDIYESLRRSEIVLSNLLEMYLMREQDAFKDRGEGR